MINNFDICRNHDGVLRLSSLGFIENTVILNSPAEVKEFMQEYTNILSKVEEYVYLLALNTNNSLLGFSELSHGSMSSSVLDVKSVFQRLLLIGAYSFILVHNHPSGSHFASKQDREIYERFLKCSKLMDIPLLDFIIITTNVSYSLKEDSLFR